MFMKRILHLLKKFDWNERFMAIAKEQSLWSKDPSTGVGAVIVSPKNIVVAMGWNGFPRKIDDSIERLNNRDIKLQYTIHAEMNAIYNACYSGHSVDECTLYVYGLPICSKCALGVVQTGIKNVIMSYSKNPKTAIWQNEFDTFTAPLFKEAGLNFQCIEVNNE